MKLKNLKPVNVFKYFEEICNIPHVSYNTERLKEYIIAFAKAHGLKYHDDFAGNVVIYKPASKGYEEHAAVIIQGHLDMVGATEEGYAHDFDNNPIELDEECLAGGFISAKHTTLGGDDGIAIAYALAILEDNSLKHPPLEVVFTNNEEVGMLGAAEFDFSLLEGKTLLNIDSEEEGVFLTGCAGGMRCEIIVPVNSQNVSGDEYEIIISGLHGGHSGEMIGGGYASANHLMGRILSLMYETNKIKLISVNGGVVDNAICDKCVARIITGLELDKLQELCGELQKEFNEEYLGIEKNISIKVGKISENIKAVAIRQDDFFKVVFALKTMPQGVISRNPDNINLVETSLNLGILRIDTGQMWIAYSLRSSHSSAKEELFSRLKLISEMLSGSISTSGIYPAWSYSRESKVRGIIGDLYKKQTGREPEFCTIHAGLECGLFYNNIRGLDIVSYGPDLFDIHTFNERMDIESAKRVYELTVELLENL